MDIFSILTLIREVHENVPERVASIIYDSKFDIAKLSHIENPAVKSVLSAKLLRPKQRDWDLIRSGARKRRLLQNPGQGHGRRMNP